MPILTKKNKYSPLKPLPHDPENRHLSKAQMTAKRIKQAEVNKKTEEYKKKLLAGDDTNPSSESEVAILEEELKILVNEAAKAEAMADSVDSEKKAKELKKKVQVLRMKIGKAKKKQ